MESTISYESILGIAKSYSTIQQPLNNIEDSLQFIIDLISRFSDDEFHLVETNVALPKPIMTRIFNDKIYVCISIPMIAIYLHKTFSNVIAEIQDVKNFDIFEPLSIPTCLDKQEPDMIDLKILKCLLLVLEWKHDYKLNISQAKR
jgi:hypothetical protein